MWVALIAVALRGSPGEITGYLGIHRDISERRRAEEALWEAQVVHAVRTADPGRRRTTGGRRATVKSLG